MRNIYIEKRERERERDGEKERERQKKREKIIGTRCIISLVEEQAAKIKNALIYVTY